ncbi:MAG TPA: glycosyltransferase family 4 protein [Candidatus Thermoplasmatota archaeon]|nr:glycosyltransferase family 4 protein [Candidatus Thermoplasmatota archaeon]
MNPFFFPRLGGLERRIYHVGRLHARKGHRVTVVTGAVEGHPDRETMDGIEVVRLPSRRLPIRWDPPVQRTTGVEAALRELDPDVVDFHYRWAPEVTKGVVSACAGRIPWVFTAHNQYGEGKGLLRPLSLLNDRRFYRRTATAHRLVCVSRFLQDELERRGVDPRRLVTVPNGAARPEVGGPEWEPDDGRAAPAAPYVIAIGRLTPEKGADLCVRALAHAVGRGADLRLVFLGRGPRVGRIQRLAHRLGVADRFTLAGWVPEATKWRLLDGALAYLHMARFEAYGISIAEAVVAGVPPVVADVGGTSEVVGGAGAMVPPGDVAAAGAMLAELAARPQVREALRRKTAARAPHLGWPDVADRMAQVYADAIAAGPPRAA